MNRVLHGRDVFLKAWGRLTIRFQISQKCALHFSLCVIGQVCIRAKRYIGQDGSSHIRSSSVWLLCQPIGIKSEQYTEWNIVCPPKSLLWTQQLKNKLMATNISKKCLQNKIKIWIWPRSSVEETPSIRFLLYFLFLISIHTFYFYFTSNFPRDIIKVFRFGAGQSDLETWSPWLFVAQRQYKNKRLNWRQCVTHGIQRVLGVLAPPHHYAWTHDWWHQQLCTAGWQQEEGGWGSWSPTLPPLPAAAGHLIGDWQMLCSLCCDCSLSCPCSPHYTLGSHVR